VSKKLVKSEKYKVSEKHSHRLNARKRLAEGKIILKEKSKVELSIISS
jgi:hypothetical protein